MYVRQGSPEGLVGEMATSGFSSPSSMPKVAAQG
jgi:hypothetical protein